MHQVQVYFAFPYIQLVLQLLLDIDNIELYSELEKIGVGPRADDDIPKNASSIRDISLNDLNQISTNASCNCSDSQCRG